MSPLKLASNALIAFFMISPFYNSTIVQDTTTGIWNEKEFSGCAISVEIPLSLSVNIAQSIEYNVNDVIRSRLRLRQFVDYVPEISGNLYYVFFKECRDAKRGFILVKKKSPAQVTKFIASSTATVLFERARQSPRNE